MAIAMARNGGIGIIHRYLSIEQQVRRSRSSTFYTLNLLLIIIKVAMVRKVKRAESYKVEHPYTTSSDTTFEELQELMHEKGVHSILGMRGIILTIISSVNTL